MQQLLAIAGLTWKAAFRFRLFWVLAVLLLGSVVGLPLLLKDDQTARGFIQLLLTYNLSVITTLLGLSTVWLACGTLARDIEECQMQMVAVKPIPRWQIWLGKWLGLLALNAALLLVSGLGVYVLLAVRSSKLPRAQQEILRNEIFVARATLKEPVPDIDSAVERIFAERIQKTPVPVSEQDALRLQIREQIKAGIQVVPPDYMRRWTIDLGLRKAFLRDQPLFIRSKFYAAQTNSAGTYLGLWQVGVPQKTPVWTEPKSQAAETFYEFQIPPNLFEENGKLTITFINRNNSALLFPIEDGFEVLYREGGFRLNYVRGLGIILCWLGLLAALGLAAASFLSFPVAAFFCGTLLFVAGSGNTLSSVVSEGGILGADHETGAINVSWVDAVLLPIFKGLLKIINLVEGFSPVEALSTGRSISWGQLGLAFSYIILLMGGLLAIAGMIILTRRELATAQGTS
ncbi:MAG TPA: ABC transporter permease subunit [Candidatus Saccharimonadales bacterium]|nr:ABC transporter permease subunit [Candidatus Saccharimonadales bacterium]